MRGPYRIGKSNRVDTSSNDIGGSGFGHTIPEFDEGHEEIVFISTIASKAPLKQSMTIAETRVSTVLRSAGFHSAAGDVTLRQ